MSQLGSSMILNKHELQAIAKAKNSGTMGVSYRNFRGFGSDTMWQSVLTSLEKRGFLKSHSQQIGTAGDGILMYNLAPELEFMFKNFTLIDITVLMCYCEDLV